MSKISNKLIRLDSIILIIIGLGIITLGSFMLISNDESILELPHISEILPYASIFIILIGMTITGLSIDRYKKHKD